MVGVHGMLMEYHERATPHIMHFRLMSRVTARMCGTAKEPIYGGSLLGRYLEPHHLRIVAGNVLPRILRIGLSLLTTRGRAGLQPTVIDEPVVEEGGIGSVGWGGKEDRGVGQLVDGEVWAIVRLCVGKGECGSKGYRYQGESFEGHRLIDLMIIGKCRQYWRGVQGSVDMVEWNERRGCAKKCSEWA